MKKEVGFEVLRLRLASVFPPEMPARSTLIRFSFDPWLVSTPPVVDSVAVRAVASYSIFW